MSTASGYISELEDFHALPVESDIYDRRLASLASTAYRILSELTFIIDNMQMDLEPSMIKKAFGGIKYDQTGIEAHNWEEYVGKYPREMERILGI